MRRGLWLVVALALLTACGAQPGGAPGDARYVVIADGDVGAEGDGPAALAAANPETSWGDGAASVEEFFLSGHGIVLVRGMTPSEALAALAPDAALPESPATEVAAWQWASLDAGDDVSSVLAAPVGDGVLLVDRWGAALLAEGAMAALSAQGDTVMVFSTVELDWMVQYAVGGELVRSFDPWAYDQLWSDDVPLPEEAGLGFGEPGTDLGQASLALVERLTGVHLTLDDLQATEGRTGIGVLLRAGAVGQEPQPAPDGPDYLDPDYLDQCVPEDLAPADEPVTDGWTITQLVC